MQLSISNTREKPFNTNYPQRKKINSTADLAAAVQFDHVAGLMKNNHRGTDDFIKADCLMLDLDNTHSEDPEDWQTVDDITDAFPDVAFYAVNSRNHMKTKTKTDRKSGEVIYLAPRPKYHIYFPLSAEVNGSEYEKLIFKVLGLFPYFDAAAIDNAHFFFGVENPVCQYINGPDRLDAYIKTVPETDILKTITKYAQERADAPDKATSRLLEYFNVKAAKTAPEAAQTTEGLDWIEEATRESRIKWLKDWLTEYDVELTAKPYTLPANHIAHPGGAVFPVACPWEEEHSVDGGPKEAAIIVDPSGKINFLCRHGHKHSWKEYRNKKESEKPNTASFEHAGDALRARAAMTRALAMAEQPKSPPDPVQEAESAPDPLDAFAEKIQGETFKPYETGLGFFDELFCGGLIRGTMTILLAAPGAGKTSLCAQLGEAIAEHKRSVIYLNLEMSAEQMLARSISARVAQRGVKMSALDVMQGYKWTEEQRAAVQESIDEYRATVAPYMQYNKESLGTNFKRILSYVVRAGEKAKAAGEEAPAVILDYLHYMTSEDKEDVQTIIKESVGALKDYAKNFETIAIVIAATNRNSNDEGKIKMREIIFLVLIIMNASNQKLSRAMTARCTLIPTIRTRLIRSPWHDSKEKKSAR